MATNTNTTATRTPATGRWVRRYEHTLSTTARCIECKRVFVPRPEHYVYPLPQCPTFKSCQCPCGGGAIETHTPHRRELPPVWREYSARTRSAKGAGR